MMNNQDFMECNNQWIDQLVDGELSDDERRALLAKLDAEPDSGGWRRCAMAFLEAQAWREAFGPVAAPALPGPAPVLTARKPPRLAILRTPAALAASVLLAFSVGWLSRGEAGPRVAQVNPAPVPSVSPLDPPSRSIPTRALVKAENPAPPLSVPTARAVAQERESPSPNPIVSRLESRGYQVDRRERVVAVETRDGRRMALPVAEVRLRYVGDRTY
jgi:hypothetical protein